MPINSAINITSKQAAMVEVKFFFILAVQTYQPIDRAKTLVTSYKIKKLLQRKAKRNYCQTVDIGRKDLMNINNGI